MKSKEEFKSDMENMENPEAFASGNEHEKPLLTDASIEETDVLSKLEAELTESKDKYLRLSAEFENYKKRVSRDRIEHSKMAGADLVLAILPVLDDMERALKSVEDVKEIAPVKEGYQLIFSKMKSSLEARGVKAMESIGKAFDVDLHDAIANIPAPKENQKGIIVDEVEKGYFLNEKVIRHAKVIVGV